MLFLRLFCISKLSTKTKALTKWWKGILANSGPFYPYSYKTACLFLRITNCQRWMDQQTNRRVEVHTEAQAHNLIGPSKVVVQKNWIAQTSTIKANYINISFMVSHQHHKKVFTFTAIISIIINKRENMKNYLLCMNLCGTNKSCIWN